MNSNLQKYGDQKYSNHGKAVHYINKNHRHDTINERVHLYNYNLQCCRHQDFFAKARSFSHHENKITIVFSRVYIHV
jgi:hypothetical protein